MPYPGRGTNDFTFVLLMIHDRANTQTDDSQWRYVLRGAGVYFGERVNIFWIGDSGLEFTPRYLEVRQGGETAGIEETHSFVIDLGVLDL